jgi:large subunit ribosomal protein L10
MNRAEKEKEVAFIRESLADAQAVVLASLKGLTVGEVTDLRRQLYDAGVTLKVVKNTLAKKAIEGTDLASLQGDFKSETAIAWSNSDVVAPAKVLMKFKKDVDKLGIKSGFAQGQRLDADAVETLAKMPSLDELRSKLLGLMQAVPAKLVRQVNAPAQNLVGVISARVAKEKDAA